MSEDNFIVVRHIKKVNLNKPIVVEGLPGVGNVARIVVDYLIEKLKAKKWLSLYSHYFPNSVFIKEDKTITLPKVEFYIYQSKEHDFVFIIGDTQPGDELSSYKLSEKLIELCESVNAKELITLGGISSKISVKNPPVFGAVTEKSYITKLEKAGVRFDRQGTIVLVGVAGLMLGLGELKSMKGFSLLSETSGNPQAIGLDASEAILSVFCAYFNLKISLKDLRENIDKINKTTPPSKEGVRKKVSPKLALPPPEHPGLQYIG